MKKRKLCALLSAAMALSAGAGALTSGFADTQVTPGVWNDEFFIGGWLQLYDTQKTSYADQLRDQAESGLNWLIHPAYSTVDGYESQMTLDEVSDVNALCEENDMYFTAKYPDPVALTQKVLSENLDRCMGYDVKDEPSAGDFASVSKTVKKYLELDPSRWPLVNLYPNYAGSTALGGSYEDYVRNWVKAVGQENMQILSYDNYPFTQAEGVRSTFFSDAEVIRKVAFESGRIKTMACTQMGSWNGTVRPTPDMAKWDVNALLAYGMKSLIHFCWVSPPYIPPEQGGEGMLDFVLTADGEKTDLYEPMQVLNWQTRQLGQVLLGIDAQHAYHTGNIPQGTEEIPKNFAVKPADPKSDFVVSLFTSKDDTQKYIMLFNKDYENSVTSTFNVDPASGIESMTWLKPDDFETLPEVGKPLPALEEIRNDVRGGSMTQTFAPGEMRLYRLDGEEVDIPEALVAPVGDLPSGSYMGEQTVNLTTFQKNADIYYTLDGSYPDPKAPQTTRCTGPVRFGNQGEANYYALRAVCVRNDEISLPVTYEYFISDSVRNAAFERPVTFFDKAFVNRIPAYLEDGSETDGSLVTDGAHNPFGETVLAPGETGWAVVDLGSPKRIGKIKASFWNNWQFHNVIIQTSETEDFANPFTVFNNNARGTPSFDESLPVGTDGEWTDTFGVGRSLSFEPVTARYIRVYNIGMGSGILTGRSIWQEIEAITALDSADHSLLSSTQPSDWAASGGGEWTVTNQKISVADDTSAGWNRSLALTTRTFKNFILEGTFRMTRAAGAFVGFGLYKEDALSPVSSTNGYYAIIENKGRVATYDNSTEYGPRNISAPGFNPDSPFVFRVVSAGEFFSISVDGKTVYTIRDPRCERDAGYISVLAATNTLEVTDLWLRELDASQTAELEQALYVQTEEVRAAVRRFTPRDDAAKLLPETIAVRDTGGNLVNLTVRNWTCPNYSRSTTGYYTFTAELGPLPEGLINLYGLVPEARIFIRPEVDTSDLVSNIELANSLEPSDFTAESWEQVRIYLGMANDALNNPYLAQSDIGVAVMRLYNAIAGLENTATDRTALAEAVAAAEAREEADYTSASFDAFRTALAEAKRVLADNLADQTAVDGAAEELEAAAAGLERLGDKQAALAALAEAEAIGTEGYTAASCAALQSAISEARAALEGTPSAEVCALAVESLNAAKAGLVRETPPAGKPAGGTPPDGKVTKAPGILLTVLGIVGIVLGGGLFAFPALSKKRKKQSGE